MPVFYFILHFPLGSISNIILGVTICVPHHRAYKNRALSLYNESLGGYGDRHVDSSYHAYH